MLVVVALSVDTLQLGIVEAENKKKSKNRQKSKLKHVIHNKCCEPSFCHTDPALNGPESCCPFIYLFIYLFICFSFHIFLCYSIFFKKNITYLCFLSIGFENRKFGGCYSLQASATRRAVIGIYSTKVCKSVLTYNNLQLKQTHKNGIHLQNKRIRVARDDSLK